jgi:hypothetical protein
MSELPPDLAIEPEPTDADPPPEAIRPDRPRIWPEEPRPPRPQIKRPMEEWLAEFESRVKQQDINPRDQATRRRRPRGLARIVPVASPPRTERVPAAPTTPTEEPRRGRRRRRGSGRGRPQPRTSEEPESQRRGQRPPGQQRMPRSRQSPPQQPASPSQPPATGESRQRGPRGDEIAGTSHRRRRRRGRGRGRGHGPDTGGTPTQGGGPPTS